MADAPRVGVYCLDVGQGDCTFVLPAKEERALLFDCKDAYVAERFTTDHGITRLEAVVVSHLDIDHIGGLLPFMKGFLANGGRIETVYVSLDREPKELGEAAATLIDALRTWEGEQKFSLAPPVREKKARVVWSGDRFEVEVILPVYADVLGMRIDGGEEPNPCSAVLRVSRSPGAIVVAGDAPLGSWERLERTDRTLLPANPLRGPHHGGDIREGAQAWSEQDLYDKVDPKTAVLSVGTRNGYGHPTEEHLAAIKPQKRRLLCTQLTAKCHTNFDSLRDGAIAQAGGVVYPYRHLGTNGHYRRGHREVPCAGSVVAWLEPDGAVIVEPAPGGWHAAYVRTSLGKPRCLHPQP